MTSEFDSSGSRFWCRSQATHSGVSGGGYFIGFVGAAIYFLQHSTTFWEGVLGVLKAMVWPAFLVYYALDFLKL